MPAAKKSSSRNNTDHHRFRKMLKILDLLNGSTPKKVVDIAKAVGTSRETVHRIIKDMNVAFDSFYPIQKVAGGWQLTKNPLIDQLLKEEDRINLATALLTPLGKLVKTKPGLYDRYFPLIQQIVEIRGFIDDKELKLLMNAMREGTYLKMKHRSLNSEKDHEIVPVKLFQDFGMLYLVAFEKEYGFLCLFSVNKILKLEQIFDSITQGQLQEYRDYINSAWGKWVQHDRHLEGCEDCITEVVFETDDYTGYHFIKNPLHSSQTQKEQHEGRVRFNMKIHRPEEFVRWSLRFGKGLKILGPEPVLGVLKHYLEDMKMYYGF